MRQTLLAFLLLLASCGGRSELSLGDGPPRAPFCGDGVVGPGELCDEGPANGGASCTARCGPPTCGDGKVDAPEVCDDGPMNDARPAFLVAQPSTPGFGVAPVARDESAVAFYGYASASSHTGLEVPGEGRLFLYADRTSGRLSLFLDFGADGSQPTASVDLEITGLPEGVSVDVADDRPEELEATSASTVRGRFRFRDNTDGGVVGGLPFPGRWSITVTTTAFDGVARYAFVDADGGRHPLVVGEPVTITAFDAPAACRPSCTAPRCGDGVLDGGERCDDGNTASGDGCSSDCRTF